MKKQKNRKGINFTDLNQQGLDNYSEKYGITNFTQVVNDVVRIGLRADDLRCAKEETKGVGEK